MMPGYNRLNFSGSLPTGERWSWGVAFQTIDGNAVDEYDRMLSAVETISEVNGGFILPSGIRSLMSTACAIDTVRLEAYSPASTLVQAAEVSIVSAPGVGSPTKPFQSSVVASLITGRPGRSYRGRIYIPSLAAALSTTTLRLTSPTPLVVATDVGNFLEGLSSILTTANENDVFPVVWSKLLQLATPVTRIQVGDVIDTMRRRRDKAVEAYETYDLTL